MDEIFSGIECRFKASTNDSIMMCILRSTMDKAHEKLKSKEGFIERLVEMSKFYELGILQLEGCLRFVKEETDRDSFILERRHEEELSDLTKIRDRLQGRLEETEHAILKKDRELTERLENELKLRQALELKERELESLRGDLVVERSKSEDLQEFIYSDRARGDENREGEICELKNAVEQQVSSLKQNLEDRRRNITSGMRNLKVDYEVADEERSWSIENKKIEQMSSDIDNLKEIFDVAFGKMQNAVFLSELEPMEQQWRCAVENDIISILIKGFIRDFRELVEPEVRKREKSIALLSEHWSDLMNEITSLRCELESFCCQNEVQMISMKGSDTFNPSSQTNFGSKISQGTIVMPLREGHDYGKSEHSFMTVGEADHMEKCLDEDSEGGGSHYVAKMIKTHESIIRKKSKERNWLKGEILQGKGYSLLRKEMEHDGSKRSIQEVIVRLDNLINWNALLGETFADYRGVHGVENFAEAQLMKSDRTDKEKMGLNALAGDSEKVDNASFFDAVEKLHDEKMKIEQENEYLNLKSMILEETYVILFKGLMEEFYTELYNFDTENQIRESTCTDFSTKVVNQWNDNTQSNKIEVQIGEETYCTVLNEAPKDFGCTHCSTLVESQDVAAENNNLHCLEGTIKEDVCTVFFQEFVKEWNRAVGSYNIENLAREEIDWIVMNETVKNFVSTANFALSRYQEVKAPDNLSRDVPATSELLSSVESLVKEDVHMVFFREMVKAWNMEVEAYNIDSLIREEINQFVVTEAFKDANILLRKSEPENRDNFSGDFLSAGKLCENLEVHGEESFIQRLDSLLRFVEVEEDSMPDGSSDIKEHNVHLDYLGLEGANSEDLLTDEESTFNSVSGKLEKALQQLVMSKATLNELGSSLGLAVVDLKMVPEQSTTTTGIVCEREHSFCLPQENENVELNPSLSVLSPLTGFPQVIVDFECAVYEKLGFNILRLEELKHKLEPLTKFVSSLKKKETIYREAFIRRCQNLHKAETEVDLLGDQVDVLLGLLEKIYMILHRYSPVLQQHFEVSEILKLIKKELTVGAAYTQLMT